MITDELKTQIIAHIGHVKHTSKGWMTRNCMVCHHYGETVDTRGRFGIIFDSDTISSHCFNCGHKSKFVTGSTFSKDFTILLSGLGIPEDTIKSLNFEAYRQSVNLGGGRIELPDTLPSTKWKEVSLPADSYSIAEWAEMGCVDSEYIAVVEYAISRGLYAFDKLYWTPSTNQSMNKRLIIPFVYNGRNYGYVARYYGDPPDKSTHRYRGYSVNDFVINLQDRYKYCIVTEGAIDALLVNGVSTLGKEITEGQRELIEHHRENIIVVPDFDKDGDKMVRSALKFGWPVSFPFWSREFTDIASAVEKYGRIAVTQSILESIDDDPLSIEVKWRLALNERN